MVKANHALSNSALESKTLAGMALWVIETRKPLHHGEVVVPLEWNLFDEHHGVGFCCEKKRGLVPHKYVDSSSLTQKLFKKLPVQKDTLLRIEIEKLYTVIQDPVQRHIMTVYPFINQAVSLGVSLPLLSLLFAFLSFFFPRHAWYSGYKQVVKVLETLYLISVSFGRKQRCQDLVLVMSPAPFHFWMEGGRCG